MDSKWEKDKNATSENMKLLEEQSVCGVPRDKIKNRRKEITCKTKKRAEGETVYQQRKSIHL